jgi:hypothetical protein
MFLSEMGQQSGNIEHTLALRSRIICAAQKIFFNERRLVQIARNTVLRASRCCHA